jgi:uncharacterized protein (TIGR00251 family)
LPRQENNAATARLSVRVQPRASRETVEVLPDGGIRVTITAPPVDGLANKAVCALFAKKLQVSKSRVEVVSGERGRNKLISIAGLTLDQVIAKLAT